MDKAEVTGDQTATGGSAAPPKGEFPEGTLSLPKILEHYATMIPGTGERILRLVEEQSAHRKQMETKALEAQISIPKRGQVFALAVTLTALVSASFCAYVGQPVPASVIGGGTLVCLAAVFLSTRRERNLPEKNKLPEGNEQ